MTIPETLEEIDKRDHQVLELEKNLVVSSAHITGPDMEQLELWSDGRRAPLIVYRGMHWVQVYLLDAPDGLDELSEECIALIKWAAAREEGFTFLKVDGDGPLLAGFPTF